MLNQNQYSHHLLPNGDRYIGSFSLSSTSLLPHGPGTYLWTTGTTYSGTFLNGTPSGTGMMTWPSGTIYRGGFKEGQMDGFGSLIGSKGGSYVGEWVLNKKSGFGEKRYSNGDVYEGMWREDVREGEGRYVWKNGGSEYSGMWRGGDVHGRGVIVWANGNRYDGNWENGVPKGNGIFTWQDGSCYVGNWSKGSKNERKNTKKNHTQPILSGIFYPGTNKKITTTKHSRHESLTFNKKTTLPLIMDDNFLGAITKKRSSVDGSKKSLTNKICPRICIWELDGEKGDITCDIIDNIEASMFYKDGRGPYNDDIRDFKKDLCCFNGEVKKSGKTISEGHKNYDLMLNLQLGVRYSVGKHASIRRELKPRDFDPMEKFWTKFPPGGSKITPPHQSAEFRWKDYCPMVFRRLRDHFQVDPADYMLAICGNDALRELSSPGKSGSFFYLTQDDRFMIKTVKKSECKVLIKMLPSYYQHVCKYKNTLVTKFFGVHCVKPVGGIKTRFIVMGNLFCSEDQIHRRFDLKGSSYGRTTDKREGDIDETTTLKDLDLNFVFRLQSDWLQELIKQINRDCEFLEAERIMDYSLLVGIHFCDNTGDKISLPPFLFQTGKMDSLENDKFIRGCQFLESQLQGVEKILDIRKSSVKLGAHMPAMAERVLHRSNYDQHTPDSVCKLASSQGGKSYEVMLYFGIIDILQDYDISKRLENAYKSLQVDPALISAVDPKLYSKRFRDFIGRVFVEDS